MALELEPTFELVPPENRQRLYQHNVLAEARYRLTIRAQKLLGKLISELNPQHDQFSEVRLSLDDFAPLVVKERNDVTFAHFTETANQLLGRFVIIQPPPVPGEKLSRTIICHWISSAVQNPNDKSITFSFDPKLTPYLLGLKRDYFSYPFLFICNFDSAYAIRLYQFLKARSFYSRPHTVPLIDFRCVMGAVEYDAKGRILKETLTRYADFKRVALVPAINEVNAKTDINVHVKEEKRPGTKIVEKLVFSTHFKDVLSANFEMLELPPEAQTELALDQTPAELQGAPVTLERISEAFGLNEIQVKKIGRYITEKGLAYVIEKMAITRSKERDNAAAFFLSALRDDYKWPRKFSPKKAVRRQIQNRSPEPELTDEERAKIVSGMRKVREKVGQI